MIGEILTKKDIQIGKLADGLVEYNTNRSERDIRDWPFFNNSFLILKKITNLNTNDFFKFMQNKVLSDQSWVDEISPEDSFRLIYSNENQLSPSDKINNEKIVEIIKNTGAKYNPHNPKVEFWFVRRSDNSGYFAKRLTKNIINKNLAQGQLRPELCFLLNYLADIKYGDVVLDPFCGSGAVVKNSLHFFKPKLVFANDIDEKHKKPLRNWSKKMNLKNKLVVKNLDSTNLNTIEDGFIDKIICDPPWGFFQSLENHNEFVTKYMTEFERVLKINGRIVILHGDKLMFEDAVNNTPLSVEKIYNILVNGKKAGIWVLNKKMEKHAKI